MFDLETGIRETKPASELGFGYRSSNLKKGTSKIVLSATFDLSREFPDNPYMKLTPKEMFAIRREKQPAGLTCGSFFKNPPGASAGALIDQAGCKGMKVGGMQVSEKHANFLLNTGGATWQDVLALRDAVKLRVFQKFNISLIEEVCSISHENP